MLARPTTIPSSSQIGRVPGRRPPLQRRLLIRAASTAAAEKAAKRAATESTALALFHSTYSPTASIDQAVNLLKEACRTKQTSPRLVAGALVHLERSTQRTTPSVPQLVSLLTRKPYLLVFSTVVPIEFLQYIPVTEFLQFQSRSATSDKGGDMTMWSEIGPMNTYYSGQFTWAEQSTPPAIEFTMPAVKVELFGKQVSEKTREQQLRRYTFLYVDEQLAVARSSSGGFTVMYHD